MKVPFVSFPNDSVFKGISKGRKGLGFRDGLPVMCDENGHIYPFFPHDGEPVDYAAPTAMSGTYTPNVGHDVTLTAVKTGVQSPAPGYRITYPGISGSQASWSQDLSTNVFTFSCATDDGDPGIALHGSGNGQVMVEHKTAGIVNGYLRVYNGTAGASLSASEAGDDCIVYLAMSDGAASTLELVDVSGGGHLDFEWQATGDIVVQVVIQPGQGASQNLDVYFDGTLEGGGTLTITLGTDLNGEPDALKNTDALIATAVNAAVFPGTCTSGGLGFFDHWNTDSIEGGSAAVPKTDGSNSATNVAAAIEGSTDFSAQAGGTGADDVLEGATEFLNGGANAAITSTVADLIAAMAASHIMTASASGPDQAELLTIKSTTRLEGGSNTVYGTPAYKGRQAMLVDGSDLTIWTAVKNDPDGTESDVWVETFTNVVG